MKAKSESESYRCLYRTSSEEDLWKLQSILKAIDRNDKLPDVGDDFLLRTFEGQTVYSIV